SPPRKDDLILSSDSGKSRSEAHCGERSSSKACERLKAGPGATVSRQSPGRPNGSIPSSTPTRSRISSRLSGSWRSKGQPNGLVSSREPSLSQQGVSEPGQFGKLLFLPSDPRRVQIFVARA